MRLLAFALAGATVAAPVAAQTAPVLSPVVHDHGSEIAQRMSDPATVDRLTAMMQSLADAFLNLPVGEIEAAAAGRVPTAADQRMTVRDAARRDDPNFDRKFAAQMARTRPIVAQSLKTLGTTLPAVIHGLREAGDAVERAAANMPDPNYPKR